METLLETEAMVTLEATTLAERLEEGCLPVGDALRRAMILAEALRCLHDRGSVHGAVTPANVKFTEHGLELLRPPSRVAGIVTPYTAPEVLRGRTPDARSDVFAFGAILFEMLTGRRAFAGEDRETLSANLANAPTPSSGSPAVDRVVGPCLARNPDARTPRMQKVILELKLLTIAARRAAAAAEPRRETIETDALRCEMREMEARFETRLSMRLQAQDRMLAEMQRSASDAIATLKGGLTALRMELADSQERALRVAPALGEGNFDAASQRILAQVERSFQSVGENIATIEQTIESMKQRTHQFEHTVAADLVDIEQTIKTQSASIESARTAMSQTDDLVERVVEALESLQTAVLGPGELGGDRPAFAVN